MTQTQIIIRPATETDIPSILELNQALFREDGGQRDPFMNVNWPQEEGHDYFSKHLSRDKSIGLLAEMASEFIGYLVGYIQDGSSLRPIKVAELESMYVREAYRAKVSGNSLSMPFLHGQSRKVQKE